VPSFGRGVRALSVTPDGAYALGLSADATLSWVDVKTGATHTWRLPKRVRAVAIAPTGDRAAALDDQTGALALYAIGASEPSDRFTDEDVNSFLFGPTAKELIVGEGHGGVWLWQPGEAEAQTQIASDAGGSVDALARSSDGARLAAASASITAGVRVWRGPAWKDPPDIIPGPRSTLALRFTADGRFLVSADTGGGLRYWRLSGAGVKAMARPDTYQQLPRPGRLYSVVRNRVTGEYLVGGDHGVLQAWPSADLDRPPLVLAPQLEAGLKLAPDVQRFVGEDGRNYLLTGHVMQVAVSADGDRIAAVDPYGFVVVIDKKAGAFISRLIPPPSTSHPAFSVALSPSGKRLAVGITSELTFMHELGPLGDAAGSVQLPSPGDAVVRLALFEDEDHLLVGDDTGRLTRWTLSAKPSRAVLMVSGPGINGAAKLADGRLAVARGDQVDILSQALGEPVKMIIGGLSGATSVAASDDGALLAAGFGDGSIRIWRTDDFSRNPILLKGHDEYIRSLAFDAPGERLVSVGDDGAIESWTIGADALAGIACAVVWRDLDDDERREFFVGGAPERPSCQETPVQTEARHN